MARDTVRGLLIEARRVLADAGIDSAGLDARLLLQAAAALRHEDIVADPDGEIVAPVASTFRHMVARRVTHEPVSRILGEREFYGRGFRVSPAVLDPRPDTEALIVETLKHVKPGARILDLGTGTGAIIVTLLAECPTASGIATDLSAAALEIARANSGRHGTGSQLGFVHCNWFDGITGCFDVIVSNPPYIALAEIAGLGPGVRDFDPWRALDGGPDGLEAYRRIASGAGPHLAPAGLIVVEIGAGQEMPVAAIFAACGLTLKCSATDLSGHVRCLVLARP